MKPQNYELKNEKIRTAFEQLKREIDRLLANPAPAAGGGH